MDVTNYLFRVILKHPETLRNLRAIVDAVDNDNLEGYEKEKSGRIRRWAYIAAEEKYFRIVFLEDGKTVLNVFPDRGYTKRDQEE